MTRRFNRYSRLLIPAALLSGWMLPCLAQSNVETENVSIVERIEAESDGNVIIEIDPELLERILTDPEVTVKKKETRDPNAKLNGYRIQ
ncbi:MAG: hypothetical protein K2K93_00710, partial [Muribaculaceae bacterium]|nr:hypothetical protein [Muribaculaceae bacterium]